MKKVIITLLVLFSMTMAYGQEKKATDKGKDRVTVTFLTSIDCDHCVEKVMKNIAYEKGVKDIKCDLETTKVSITYLEKKNNPDKLKKALEKIGFTAKLVKDDKKEEGKKE